MSDTTMNVNDDQQKTINSSESCAKLPISVKCNKCLTMLTNIKSLSVQGIPGMRLAGSANCPKCSQTTWVLDGNREAIELLQDVITKEYGSNLKINAIKKADLQK